LATPLFFALAATACGAAPQAGEESASNSADPAGETVGHTAEAISMNDICKVVKGSRSMNLAGATINLTTACEGESFDTDYYLGGAPSAQFATSNSRVEAQALYCALKGTDGHAANAYFNTPFGKMGIQGRIAVLNSDPASMHVVGQRIGQLNFFGLTMDMETQKFDFNMATEHQAAQTITAVGTSGNYYYQYPQALPEQTGQYALMTESGQSFLLLGHATIPIAGPIMLTADLNFRMEAPYDSGNHYAVSFDGTPTGGLPAYASKGYFPRMFEIENASMAARQASASAYLTQCNACLASIPPGGLNVCNCPAAIMQEAERLCGASGCVDSFFANLSDGRVPYEGITGIAGPYYDNGIPTNWWHFGTPKSGSVIPLVPGEPSYALRPRSIDTSGDMVPTTAFGLNLDLIMTYDILKLTLGLNNQFQFRDGLAVRENQIQEPDAHPSVINTTSTWLDAEGSIHIDAGVKLEGDFPWPIGHTTLIDQSFSLVNSATNSNASSRYVTSEVDWTDNAQSTITGYNVGVSAQSVASCLNVPAASQPEVPVMDPHQVASTIAQFEHDNFYACNIQYCNPSTGTMSYCTAATTGQAPGLKCTPSNVRCECGDTDAARLNKADICGPNGVVVAGTPAHPTYCDQTACGGEACFSQADCSQGTCSGGCCQIVK